MDAINDIRICELPDMRVLVSLIKSDDGNIIDDMGKGLRQWAMDHDIPCRAGMREEFAYFDAEFKTFVFMIRIQDGFQNSGPYPDSHIKGGLEAVVSGERDHLVDRYRAVIDWVRASEHYELDKEDGKERHPALMDWLTPTAIHREFDLEQQDIFIPIRRRRG
jgi:hypothetical protein